MSEETEPMTCAEFQAQMAEMIGLGENAASHSHIQTCELCRALLADLETIAEAARQLFPVADPPEHLWEHIESAIKSDAGGVQSSEDQGGSEHGSSGSLSAETA